MVQVLDKKHTADLFLPKLRETPDERLQHLISAHEGKLAASFDELLGSGGSPDESADDIIKAVREWRDFPNNGSHN